MTTLVYLVELVALVAALGWQGPVVAQPTPSPAASGFSVINFGARPERPDMDSTGPFQHAIDACTAAGGGVVTVPHGRYWFDGYLILGGWGSRNYGCALVGEGRGPYDPMVSPIDRAQGPTLLVRAKSGATGQPFILIVSSSSAVEDLIFAYPDQRKVDDPNVGNLGPIFYPPTIRVEMPAKIRRCTFANGYQDVEILVGRVTLDELYLGGIANAVTINNAADSVRINSSMIEPFASWGLPPLQGMHYWSLNHATGIVARKADSLQVSDTLVFGRYAGLVFEESLTLPYGSVSGMVSDVNCDTVRYCVIARATEPHVGVVFTNLLMGPYWDADVGWAIWLPRSSTTSAYRARISVVGGSIRYTWRPGNRGYGFQADGGGELYIKNVIGHDLGPRL